MQLVTIKIVAERLMVKESTLYSWVHSGSIPFHKLNGLIRFDMAEIEAWISSSKHGPSPRTDRRKPNKLDAHDIIRNAIDSAKDNRYNPSNGKPGQHRGLRKEV
jgi:excisionase family DNA binding protein